MEGGREGDGEWREADMQEEELGQGLEGGCRDGGKQGKRGSRGWVGELSTESYIIIDRIYMCEVI